MKNKHAFCLAAAVCFFISACINLFGSSLNFLSIADFGLAAAFFCLAHRWRMDKGGKDD